jgi:hypothetical protein
MKGTVDEVIDFLNDNYDCYDDIAVIVWSADDVSAEADRKGILNLTNDEISDVLENINASETDWTALGDGLDSVLDARALNLD